MRDLELEMWIAENILKLDVVYQEGDTTFGTPEPSDGYDGEVHWELAEFPPISEDSWQETDEPLAGVYRIAEKLNIKAQGSSNKEKLQSIKEGYSLKVLQ